MKTRILVRAAAIVSFSSPRFAAAGADFYFAPDGKDTKPGTATAIPDLDKLVGQSLAGIGRPGNGKSTLVDRKTRRNRSGATDPIRKEILLRVAPGPLKVVLQEIPRGAYAESKTPVSPPEGPSRPPDLKSPLR